MIGLALALLLPALGARAEVREIKSMSEILPEIRPTTLLVFDLDNTLVEPAGNIGSDQWYDYIVKALRRDGLDEAAAEAQAGALWTRMLGAVKVKPVEELTPILLREQQKRGLKILALTARGPEDAPATFAQLKAIGRELRSIGLNELAEPLPLLGHLVALKARRVGVLLVEQKVDAVLRVADRVALIENGRIARHATPAELAAEPEVLLRYVGVRR